MKQTISALIAGDIKASTKWFLAALVALPEIAATPFCASIIGKHPHIAATVATLVGIGSLLHIPVVANLVGLNKTTTKSVQVGDATVTESTSTTVTEQK